MDFPIDLNKAIPGLTKIDEICFQAKDYIKLIRGNVLTERGLEFYTVTRVFHHAKHSQESGEVMWVICNEEELCELGGLCELDGAEPTEKTVRRENSRKAKVKEAYLNVSQTHTLEPVKKGEEARFSATYP